jgi:glucose-1-phosphate thymidylyltransferase
MKVKHGVILAGGEGTRLLPFTQAINKSLLNINGKAVIDYPINTLKQMGVENVSIILGGSHFEQIVNYLQDGSRYEMNFHYVYQGVPRGISQAISLCKEYVKGNFVTILGDNVYQNNIKWKDSTASAQIVLTKSNELKRFGVASLKNNLIEKIEEKPFHIDEINYDNYAITGCYLFDENFFSFFNETSPSKRGEFEITSIIEKYNLEGKLDYTINDGLWIDAGTHDSINFVNNLFYQRDKNQ